MPKVTKKCEQCGQEFNYYSNSNYPTPKFCSRICFGLDRRTLDRSNNKKICVFCKKEFEKSENISWLSFKEKKYCSKECHLKGRESNYISKVCKFCNKEFFNYLKDSATNWNVRKFCSKKCSAKSKSNLIKKNCKSCGKEIFICQSRYKNKRGIYCSKLCYGKPNEKSKMENIYKKYSKIIYGYNCEKCAQHKGLIDCHHIDGNNRNNPLNGSNWIRLCRKCHHWAHKMARTITRYLTREEILGIVPIGQRLKKIREDKKQMKLF